MFDWDKALRINDVAKQVAIFRDTLMNIMQNFVPNETFSSDDIDPTWVNKEIEHLNRKTRFKNDSLEALKFYFISISLKHSTTN